MGGDMPKKTDQDILVEAIIGTVHVELAKVIDHEFASLRTRIVNSIHDDLWKHRAVFTRQKETTDAL